jgi:hypothetical protein
MLNMKGKILGYRQFKDLLPWMRILFIFFTDHHCLKSLKTFQFHSCYELEDSMVLGQMQWKDRLYNSL